MSIKAGTEPVILLNGLNYNFGGHIICPLLYIGGVKMLVSKIGAYCRGFRMNKLQMRLEDVEGSEQIKTLSGFEHGRSTNIRHLFKYVKACQDRQQKIEFFEGLLDELEGGKQ